MRLACLSHAASVHCEPGSNSSIICRIRFTRPLRAFQSAHFKLEGLPIGKLLKQPGFLEIRLAPFDFQTVAKKFFRQRVTQSIKVIAHILLGKSI